MENPSDTAGSPRRILVVEDNPALALVAGFNLQRAGYQVTTACNGVEAWGLLGEEPFDLVITDQQMPEMTGSELCEAMRDSEAHARIPVVLLTAKGLELDVRRLKEELGVVRTFSKPYSPSELVEAVHDLLRAVPELSST